MNRERVREKRWGQIMWSFEVHHKKCVSKWDGKLLENFERRCGISWLMFLKNSLVCCLENRSWGKSWRRGLYWGHYSNLVREEMSWTNMILVETVRSNQIMDIFERQAQHDLLTDFMWRLRLWTWTFQMTERGKKMYYIYYVCFTPCKIAITTTIFSMRKQIQEKLSGMPKANW